MQSNISKSEEYLAFRSTVALKSVIVDHDDTKVSTYTHLYLPSYCLSTILSCVCHVCSLSICNYMNVCVQVWRLYDVGPRSVACPIVFLPPLSGTADVFFRQLLSLSSRGLQGAVGEC